MVCPRVAVGMVEIRGGGVLIIIMNTIRQVSFHFTLCLRLSWSFSHVFVYVSLSHLSRLSSLSLLSRLSLSHVSYVSHISLACLSLTSLTSLIPLSLGRARALAFSGSLRTAGKTSLRPCVLYANLFETGGLVSKLRIGWRRIKWAHWGGIFD